MNLSSIRKRLGEHIARMPIIDTHEHVPASEAKRDPSGDLFTEFLSHYFNRDLISAGLPPSDLERVLNKEGTVVERWSLLEPYWEASRYTGYGRSLQLAAADIYGIPFIDSNSIELLYDRFAQGMESGHYEKILKTMSNIKVSIVDCDLDCDRDYFRSVFQMGHFIFPENVRNMRAAVQGVGFRPSPGFDDWLDACDAAVDAEIEGGGIALKIPMAYHRTLAIGPALRHEAEECFVGFAATLEAPDWMDRPLQRSKAFEDYMIHHIFRRLKQHDLPVQIHSGLQEGNGNELRNANPLLLIPMFQQYPDLDFILMHIGYPWYMESGALAKMFPNVYLDMCWSHIISPHASKLALREWLDAVPYTKICAFGGDYCFIDGIYAHQAMARENVADVLAEKVADGLFDEAAALRIAFSLFHENPYRIFQLERHGVEPLKETSCLEI